MSCPDPTYAARPEPDALLQQIADYVLATDQIKSEEAFENAHLCLIDTLGCGLLALSYPACTKLLGPTVPGAEMPNKGSRVPGTHFELDPVQAAFNIGTMVRWLDYNDTWLAAEWGHPSDNLGGILAIADYLSRKKDQSITMHDVLVAMIQAHEIQGVLALKNSFNRVGLDHVLLVRIASTAVVTRLLGGTRNQIINALSQAFLDGGSLRAYRHSPNTGSRKSWAAGDATSRAVKHALFALKDEMGYPSALTTKTWGFYDVVLKGKPIQIPHQGFGTYVMENILFKISFPAEFHAQTAVEAAIKLHPKTFNRLDQIKKIVIETQESGKRIIDKTGPLNNPADRDHCIQYMVAVPLIKGSLTAEDYEDAAAQDPRIDKLREKMVVIENQTFSKDYLDPSKRSIGNAVEIIYQNNKGNERVAVEYPVGHRRRRKEGKPLLLSKFTTHLQSHFSKKRAETIYKRCTNRTELMKTQVAEFMEWFTVKK